jgi:hypothetical protein
VNPTVTLKARTERRNRFYRIFIFCPSSLAGLTHSKQERAFSQATGSVLLGRAREVWHIVAAVKMQSFVWIAVIAVGALSVALVSVFCA